MLAATRVKERKRAKVKIVRPMARGWVFVVSKTELRKLDMFLSVGWMVFAVVWYIAGVERGVLVV